LRLHDHVARIGGEEFVILLPNAEQKTAFAIAEKLRKKIAESHIELDEEKIRFTVSIGVSQVRKTDTYPIEALDRADKNLFKAKESGRNRVCIS
jgi:diguanylate cyclase (GGDEF)-like protein